MRIEDYALLGDCQTAGLVGRDGSIDWLCLPYFDSGACFAALLGDVGNGRWKIAPACPTPVTRRRYVDGTLVLETTHATPEGEVTVIDFMPQRTAAPDLVRIVAGARGAVPMRMELTLRFDYGSIVPWVRTVGGVLTAVAGPDAVRLRTPVACRGEGLATVAEFTVREGDRVPFVLTWNPSYRGGGAAAVDAEAALGESVERWRAWSGRCTYHGPWRDAVVRSVLTLKALTDARTGGVVAAATTSLPERLGGVRNWDYRFCWLRDATFTLYSLMSAGYHDEARAWREWLLRAVAGSPSEIQILYGVRGERRVPEMELPWLAGYEGSRPVRVGNAAHAQLQLDVYGEVIDVLHQCARCGLHPSAYAWEVQRAMVGALEGLWREPDEGIWEVRGPRRHFTHSKVMAWVAVDRAIKSSERLALDAPLARWRALRDEMHAEVCRRGYDARRGAFVQSYGSQDLDASLLMIPLVGFLPASDPRVRGTVEAVERELVHGGLVRRYSSGSSVDGLPEGEGAFLACSFWLADCLHMLGRTGDARALFERLLSLRNDVGLLSEEYDPDARRLVGNMPQAFSHVSLVNTAINLSHEQGPAAHRKET